MLDEGGPSEPFLGLTMGPISVGQSRGSNTGPVEDLPDDSSSDESIFLGECRL